MRLPSDPLIITASPALTAPAQCSLDFRRSRRPAPLPLGCGIVEQMPHVAARRQRPDRHRPRQRHRRDRRDKLALWGPKFQHVAEHRDAARIGLRAAPSPARRARRASTPDWRCSFRRSAATAPPGDGQNRAGAAARRRGRIPASAASGTRRHRRRSRCRAATTASEFCAMCAPGAPSV